MVEYKYDAWGKCVVDASTTNITLANLNPFRYRGYYYDTETNLYFLQTRYYDPEVGRFITIDDLSYLDPETINGLNLYAYCGNNPVMGVDKTGNFAISLTILGLIIGAVVCSAVGGAVAYNVAKSNGQTGWALFGWTMVGVVGGGAYQISKELYEALPKDVSWANNVQYLVDANALGSQFVIWTEKVTRVTTDLWKEVQYLIEHGISWELF